VNAWNFAKGRLDMRYRNLGRTDVKVSEISLGCWTLGGQTWRNGNPIGWADVDEGEAAAAINEAIDAGVNHFDNADVYGEGRAERMLAKALGPRSKAVVIATKVGHFPGTAENAYEPVHIRQQCEQSLLNLRRDWIDIYYFHHGDFGPDDRYVDDAVATFHRLRDEGKIRLIGLSAYSHDDFVRLVPKIQPDVLQGKANALDMRLLVPDSPTRKVMEKHKLSLVAFSPLGQGLLLDKFKAGNPPKFEPGDNRRPKAAFAPEALAALAPKLAKIKQRFGSSVEDLARVAVQYLLADPLVGCVIPGFRNRQQVRSNLAGADRPLSPEDVRFVREVFA
jgi:myo-inositol catabolism protein IolS